jgi:hypothetical protein
LLLSNTTVMDIEYTQDDIDAFVKGTLSPEEHDRFLQKIKENEALSQAVAETRFQFDVAQRLIERDLRDMLKSWRDEKKTPPPSEPAPTRKRWLWAAVAVAVAVWWFGSKTPQQQIQRAEPATVPSDTATSNTSPVAGGSHTGPELLEPPKPSPESRERKRFANEHFALGGQVKSRFRGGDSKSKASTTKLQSGKVFFSEKKYEQAAAALRGIQSGDSDYYDAQIMLGDAYFLLAKYPQAEMAYLILEDTGEAGYTDTVDWNLLMTYLAQYPEKQTEFRELKAKIKKDPDHPAIKDGRMEELEAAMKTWH